MARRALIHRAFWLWVVVLLAVATNGMVQAQEEGHRDVGVDDTATEPVETVEEGDSSTRQQEQPPAAGEGETISTPEQKEETVKSEAGEPEPAAKEEPKKKKEATTKKDDDFDVENEDWGTYYDPQNVFCGKFDCYKILGFDYESFGKVKPSTKEITKRYRQLSREWHPDKSKHKSAKSRFVKIARAYEVLTHKEQRAEYDYMRYDQDAYFQKYGANVLWSYAPQTDTALVVLLLLVVGNVVSWYAQKHRWQMVADRLIKAAVEDWLPREGGTPESKALREEAQKLLLERETMEVNDGTTDDANNTAATNGTSAAASKTTASSSSTKKKSSKGANKVSGRERKRLEQEALQPIVTELVNQMEDFGGGFHKPTYKDLLIVTMAKMPYKVASGTAWQMKYWARRLQKKELNQEEKMVLTERAVGPVVWAASSDEDREEMLQRELWIMENFVDWKEEQEIKTLSSADQKYYMKMKKKGMLDKLDKLE